MESLITVAQTQVQITPSIAGIVALLAGILILVLPRILNYVIAVYLIVIGLIQIFDIGL